ncbi:uncharacterized protein (TIGR02413 family) [Oikeobacillus pervagus]|uniref:Uncharacterized protein (TIGR02413 family) n=1 Tax=Oikeobacillus pervagus TaxID=1325931 RepID=A0AAJ1WKU5_9BACI|nr:YrzI family small protein [Oikeobacillus pervagus]MDQ0215506.1 uncharacterized protein (TIGR02413 family) [Oikeobacillus pervagus]
MTLNIYFVKITIERRKKTAEEYEHEKNIEKIFEENRCKYYDLYRIM